MMNYQRQNARNQPADATSKAQASMPSGSNTATEQAAQWPVRNTPNEDPFRRLPRQTTGEMLILEIFIDWNSFQ
jgi:hypothetical protein